MKYIFLAIGMSFPVLSAQQKTVVGQPTINDVGIITILECISNKEYKLGVMASNRYFLLSRKIRELSKTGSVLVTVEGELIDKSVLELNKLKVINVKQGQCSETST